MKTTILAAAAASALIVSCNAIPDALKDQTYQLTELNGTEYVSAGEKPAVISFHDGKLSADLGGNSISADCKVGKNGALTLTSGASTLMLVPDEIREDEFVSALNSVGSYSIEGDVISLISKDGNAVIKATRQ